MLRSISVPVRGAYVAVMDEAMAAGAPLNSQLPRSLVYKTGGPMAGEVNSATLRRSTLSDSVLAALEPLTAHTGYAPTKQGALFGAVVIGDRNLELAVAAVGGAPILAAAATNPIVQSLVGDSSSKPCAWNPKHSRIDNIWWRSIASVWSSEAAAGRVFSLALITSLSNR